ncbi:hypothetical protein LLEC1_02190 [Akanthomyces lecanii]|uniref:C2H2-type domain-containing protein n=1 Tax=Cordyceps confragosa TaxID=2714763 RepID=A0A179IS96_CORDF|nr:hypothetical protein LLEC1_02190 [Akanthomyces lecanii]
MYGCYECDGCGREFGSEHAMVQHKNAKGHWTVECGRCYDRFVDQEDCQEHEYNCHNYCADCDREFQSYNNLRMSLTTATGLAHHLEMNACPNATTNRDIMYNYVRGKDPNGIISKKLLEWQGSATYEASERTWNGDGYECYLCHRDFNSLRGLNQHINSAAHQQALYHCPNRDCRDFKSLAGIINHLESETCGITRFGVVQRGVTNMIGGGRLLCF